MRLPFGFLLLVASVLPCAAWHNAPHYQITRAAVLSLPDSFQELWGLEKENLIYAYCMLPDHFRNHVNRNNEAGWKPMEPYCVKPDGNKIHNITWDRAEDLASLEYVMHGIISGLRNHDAEDSAKHAGVLAHFVEDSTCPAHALSPMVSIQILADLFPPPPGMEDIHIHSAIEKVAPSFEPSGRKPQSLGPTVPEAAQTLLPRIYERVKLNRANLPEIVLALYKDDQDLLDRFRLEAEQAGADLLADALYTALLLAGLASSEHAPGS